MSTQLLLIRHGESTWNMEGRIQGEEDPPLSRLGKSQADALGRRLRRMDLAAIYCSPAMRARDTALAIATPHGLSVRTERGLLEVNLGTWQGRLISEFQGLDALQYRDWERNPASHPPPQGEPLEEALARISAPLQRIVDHHIGRTVVVVTHSIIGRVALSHLLGCQLDLVARLRIKQASIAKLSIENDLAVLERLSDTKHLLSIDTAGSATDGTGTTHQR